MREICESANFSPVHKLLEIAKQVDDSPELQIRACAELLGYIYPKLKNVQLTAPALSDFTIDELRSMLTKIQQARAQTIQ